MQRRHWLVANIWGLGRGEGGSQQLAHMQPFIYMQKVGDYTSFQWGAYICS